jgi:N-acetylneuraminic acid mutarotase
LLDLGVVVRVFMRQTHDAARSLGLLGILCGSALAAAGCGGDDGGGGGDGPVGGACEQSVPWASGPVLPLGATQETAVVSLDGKVYVLGGFNGRFGVTDEVQIFDPEACTWSFGPKLPVAAHHLNAAVLGDTIYVAGVLLGEAFTASGDTWSWSPARETAWSVLPSMPAGSERGASIAGGIGDRIYIAGGLRNNESVADVSAYDVVARTWSAPLPPLPSARDHACGAVVGDKLHFIGGRRTGLSAAVHAYTPGGTWEEKASMPTARAGVGCGVVGDEIVVVGGEGNPASGLGVFPQVEAYTPAADTWRSLVDMESPRHGMGAAGHGGKLYVPGGATRAGFAATARFEILTL